MIRVLLVVVCVEMLLACGVAHAADWNQWRGPNRDGVAPTSAALIESLPVDGLKPLWVTESLSQRGGNGGWSSPIIADGKVYAYLQLREKQKDIDLPPVKFPSLSPEARAKMTDEAVTEYEKSRREEGRILRDMKTKYSDVVYCFDLRTGRSLWNDTHASVHTSYRPSSTPAVIDGKLYMLGGDRVARCLDATNGTVVWETPLFDEYQEPEIASSFAIADGIAVILAGKLFGIDARSGRMLWEGDPQTTKGTHSSPVIWKNEGKSYAIVNCGGPRTACFEVETGRELWREQTGATRSTPVIVGDRLITYASTRKEGVQCYRLSLDKPKLLWKYQGVKDSGASPVVANDLVFAYGDKRLACIDLATGKRHWQTNLDVSAARYTSLVASDDIVFLAWDGLLAWAADGDKFRLLYQARLDRDSLLGTEDQFRARLGLAEIEREPDGQQKAERIWNKEIGTQGPLDCATPALADGLLVMRLDSKKIACYDLRAKNDDTNQDETKKRADE